MTDPTDAAVSLADPPTELVDLTAADETAIVEAARLAVSQCNWVIGQCAAEWTERYAEGRTDGDFAELIGLSSDQVYQRRRVWETFADVRTEYAGLRWSHFYAAVTWDDAPDSLGWAEEMGATVAEMRAWRRAQRGDDLTQPDEPSELPPFEPSSILSPTTTHIASFDDANESDRPAGSGDESKPRESDEAMALARQTGESDYSPYSPDARGEAESEAKADDKPVRPLLEFKKIAKAMERLTGQLNGELMPTFHAIPGDVQDRVLESFDDLAAKIEQLR